MEVKNRKSVVTELVTKMRDKFNQGVADWKKKQKDWEETGRKEDYYGTKKREEFYKKFEKKNK